MRKLILILSGLCVLGVIALQYKSQTRVKPVAQVQVNTVPEAPAFIATHRPGILSVANEHVVFLADDDKVFGWGRNEQRQLNEKYDEVLSSASPIGNPAQVLAVHTGNVASYLITQDGRLWRRGFADMENKLSIKFGEYLEAFPDKRWRKVEEHWGLGVGIDSNGQLWAWRDADFFNGKMSAGVKRETAVVELRPMSIDRQWQDFCVSHGTFDAIDAQGVWWHSEPMSKLAFNGTVVRPSDDSAKVFSINLINVPAAAKMRSVYCRDNSTHIIALDEDHQMWGYGENKYGELGDGDDDPYKDTPAIELRHAKRLNSQTWIHVAIGTGFTIAVARDGSLWSWGLNTTKALGLESEQSHHSKPQLVDKKQTWSAVGAGYDFAVAMNQQGELYAWGSNSYGQLADGKISKMSLLPLKIQGLRNSATK